jgi:excinuclease ABC subunit B
MRQTSVADAKEGAETMAYIEPEEVSAAADPVLKYMNKNQLQKAIDETKKRMVQAAKDMEFMEAARLRDEMFALQKQLESHAE